MSMMKQTAMAFALLAWMAPLAAQDPLTTLPEAYQVQFENEWVKVVRVHYAAGVKLPVHTHPPGTTAYVYLNDSDGVVFRHEGGSSRAVTRPAVKTGSIRLAGGGEEHHTAENPATEASHFLRIQFKTLTGSRSLRLRVAPPAMPPGGTSITVDYRSEPLVIQRFVIGPGQSIAGERIAPESGDHQSLWVAVPSGDTRWVPNESSKVLENTGTTRMDVLRFIVRTAK